MRTVRGRCQHQDVQPSRGCRAKAIIRHQALAPLLQSWFKRLAFFLLHSKSAGFFQPLDPSLPPSPVIWLFLRLCSSQWQSSGPAFLVLALSPNAGNMPTPLRSSLVLVVVTTSPVWRHHPARPACLLHPRFLSAALAYPRLSKRISLCAMCRQHLTS